MRPALLNFLRGFGSILNFFPPLPPSPLESRVKEILARTDAEALAEDWRAVGFGVAVDPAPSLKSAELPPPEDQPPCKPTSNSC